ncbi:MAG TPA: zinc ABC transporter substrate-binding protein [Acidimicrobiales bacterium]
MIRTLVRRALAAAAARSSARSAGSARSPIPAPARWLLVLPVLLALAAAACGGDGGAGDAGGDDGRLAVVATVYPIADAAAAVAGDRAEVTNLTPPGAEPHDVELDPDQVDDLLDADLVLYLGGGFQPAVEEAVEDRDGPTVDLLDRVAVGDGVEPGTDPHVWLDPGLMADLVDGIEQALADAAPDDAPAFAAGAADYRNLLAGLDRDIEARLANCERHVFVTSHGAFGYLARRYGLTELSIAGQSPEAEPDPDRLAELADRIEASGVTTVFYEELVDPGPAETLAREAGVDTAPLSPLEGLSEEQRDAGDDYFTVMAANADRLAEALGCTGG